MWPTLQHVWAGDREQMTFDPVTGHFNGGIAGVSTNGTRIMLSRNGSGAASNSSLGGALSVLAGAGAGQYRRIVSMPDTHTVVIDRPFTTALDAASSVVQVKPATTTYSMVTTSKF